MAELNLPRPGRFVTFRLFREDRELLRDLSQVRGVRDRYSALLELTEVVDHLKLEDVRDRRRLPLRIKMPDALDEAIKRRAAETGQTSVDILLKAVRVYHDRHATEPRSS